MTGKKGMELSVNFIVTFILAIVLFGMGIIFARMIMSGGTDLTKDTYNRYDEQLGQLVCSRGEQVCISNNNKEIESGNIVVFPITLKNGLQLRTEFIVKARLARAINTDNELIYSGTGEIPPIKWMPKENSLVLDPGESNTAPILVKPADDCPPGTYSFRVNVETAVGESYPSDRPKTFTLKVT